MKQINDYLWKGIIEDLVEDFLLFFFPAFFGDFDLSKGVEFLDKELDQLFIESNDIQRRIDKLIKVYMKDGQERWFLIHVEVQGYHDLEFPLRMYIYEYRIYDKYGVHPVSIAIYTDKNKSFKPNEYKHGFMGTEITYKYNTYKVLEQDLAFLQDSNNPFATVIECVYVALQKGEITDDELYSLKLDLVKKLLKKNFSKKKIVNILNFIKYYVRFKDERNGSNFDADIAKITNKKYNMGVQEILIWQAQNKGIEQGIEQGRELFLKNGISKKLDKGLTIQEIADLYEVDIDTVIEIINKYGLSA